MGAILMDTATELNKPLLQPQKQYAKEGLSGWLTRLCDLANSVKNIMPQLMLKESLIQQEVPLSCPSWFEETVCYMLSRLARLFINKAIAANTAFIVQGCHPQTRMHPSSVKSQELSCPGRCERCSLSIHPQTAPPRLAPHFNSKAPSTWGPF